MTSWPERTYADVLRVSQGGQAKWSILYVFNYVSLIFPVRLSAFAYLPIAFWSSQSLQISLDMHTVREHIRVSSKRFLATRFRRQYIKVCLTA